MHNSGVLVRSSNLQLTNTSPLQTTRKSLGRAESLSQPLTLVIGLVGVALIGLLDYLTGYELSFAIFYIAPLCFVAWFGGRTNGILISAVSAVTVYLVNRMVGDPLSHPAILCWDAATKLCFFIAIAVLLSGRRRAQERQKTLALKDQLTGAINDRAFKAVMEMEMNRAHRHQRPFTLAYIDVGNFKAINDTLGPRTGDELLRVVVQSMRKNLRQAAVVARVGGDEFALVLPETQYDSAQVVLERTRTAVLEAMQQNNWPVTLSIAALTCIHAPLSLNVLLKHADDMLSAVKINDKGGIHHEVYQYVRPECAASKAA